MTLCTAAAVHSIRVYLVIIIKALGTIIIPYSDASSSFNTLVRQTVQLKSNLVLGRPKSKDDLQF